MSGVQFPHCLPKIWSAVRARHRLPWESSHLVMTSVLQAERGGFNPHGSHSDLTVLLVLASGSGAFPAKEGCWGSTPLEGSNEPDSLGYLQTHTLTNPQVANLLIYISW